MMLKVLLVKLRPQTITTGTKSAMSIYKRKKYSVCINSEGTAVKIGLKIPSGYRNNNDKECRCQIFGILYIHVQSPTKTHYSGLNFVSNWLKY